LGISSRGLGTVNESSKYVNEDFELLTFDLVSSPSNPTSFVNGIYEGKEFNIKEDIVDYELQLREAREKYTKKL
jgi:hypothetical protein